MIRVPDSAEVGGDQLAFDPAQMGALFTLDRGLGREGDSWQSTPPTTQEIAPWLLESIKQRH